MLGMKSMGGSGEIIIGGAATPQEALRYAMSLPVATTISGVESMEILQQNLAIARGFQPMTDAGDAGAARPLQVAGSRWPDGAVQGDQEI